MFLENLPEKRLLLFPNLEIIFIGRFFFF